MRRSDDALFIGEREGEGVDVILAADSLVARADRREGLGARATGGTP